MIPVQVKEDVRTKVLEALEAYFRSTEEAEDDTTQEDLNTNARLLDFWLYQYNAEVFK